MAGTGRAAKARSPGTPTPEERAALVVTRLERFIRDGRSASAGVSFKSWQAMARQEIADALRAVEDREARENRTLDRLVLLAGAALSTIGVWGMALALDQAPDRVIAAGLVLFAGLVVLWIMGALGLRSPIGRIRDARRRAALARVDDLHRRVRRLEIELKSRAKALQAERDVLDEGS